MKSLLKYLFVFAALLVIMSGIATAATYTKNSFPTSSGNVISCDGNDRRVSCSDTGDGRNHNCVPVAINSCQAFEGRNNYGSPGCLIVCERQEDERCTDGTKNGFCSANVPSFCDNGKLVKRASFCGCPGNLVRSGEDCIQQSQQAPQTPQSQTCSDGTSFSQCSSTRPLFCNNGVLISRASVCGCPSSQIANGDNCITQQAQTCSDNTPFNQCSSARPLFCLGGSLINRALTCGCPPGQVASGDNCIVQAQACSDGTASGQCSSARPLLCESGNLVNRASQCGCPSGQTASGNNCVPSTQVASSTGNKLTITDIDVKIDGKTSSNIDDNDRIGKEAKPESSVELRITVKNDFTSSENVDIEDVTVIAAIEGIGGTDIEDESNSFDLRPQSDKTATLKFKLPLGIDEGDYNIAIEAQGEDENGDEHSDQADVELEVQKEKHDLRFLSFGFSPGIVDCSTDMTANARVMNIGSEDESNAAVDVSVDNGVSIARDNFPIQSESSNAVTRLIRPDIGNRLEPGLHTLTANLYSSDGKVKDTRASSLTVLNCTAPDSVSSMQQFVIRGPDTDTEFLSGLFRNINWRGLIFFLAIIIIVLLVIVIIVSLAAGIKRQEL
ncbi:hypothetical protein HYX08_02405 [Candidatus Woesearchaeota archaeon]|nr:hypothetical protein [Candidatus Woesearchaeota archaeon]